MWETIIAWLLDTIFYLGYPGILILMTIESSFIPFPSEIVMIPAGYLAYQSKLDMMIVILMGIIGSILGALVNYYLALYLGRPLLHRYHRYFFLNETKLNKIDGFFDRHGHITTFIGRLIPVIRQYISFPAGLAKMSITKFIFYTSLGAGIWVTILTWIGYLVGSNQELIQAYTTLSLRYVFLAIIILVAVYSYAVMRKKKKLLSKLQNE